MGSAAPLSNNDLEHQLLTILIEDADEIANALKSGVRSEVFEDSQCRAVFDLTVGYWQANGTAPTRYVIDTELPGFPYAVEVDVAPSWLAEQLRKRYAVNQGQALIMEAVPALAVDPYAALRTLYNGAYGATETITPGRVRSDMSDVASRRERYLTRGERTAGVGFPLGIVQLDEHTGGLMPGELAVVGGHPAGGKSFFLVNAAVALRRAGHVPILFTLEMSIAEMEDRVDALWSGVSFNRLSRSRLTDEELVRYRDGQDQLADAGGILIESPEIGDRTVGALITRARQAGADMVLIDQLSHMEAGRSTKDLKEHHGSIMKQLSIEISRHGQEIPCVLAAQLRRPTDGQRGGGPDAATIEMHHFANAAEIEREVDLALGLACTGEERRQGTKRLHILKGRRFNTKSWITKWELGDYSRIEVMNEL